MLFISDISREVGAFHTVRGLAVVDEGIPSDGGEPAREGDAVVAAEINLSVEHRYNYSVPCF